MADLTYERRRCSTPPRVVTWTLLLQACWWPVAAASPPIGDACDLLLDADIRAVQEIDVVERIASARRATGLQVLQCYYRTAERSRSVSLALSVPVAAAGDGARRYWEERFHPAHTDREARRPPPRPVEGLGEEAFWVGDTVTGALYVLAGDSFLRLSVGGVRDEAMRQARSAALAEQALARMATLGTASSPGP